MNTVSHPKCSNLKCSNHKCSDCGAELILVEEKTVQAGNNLSLITVTTYRCSNAVCQEESDKKNAKRRQLYEEKELLKQKRLAAKKSLTPST